MNIAVAVPISFMYVRLSSSTVIPAFISVSIRKLNFVVQGNRLE